MKKFLKWFGIIVGVLVVLVVLALIIIPKFINIQKFKPTIERTVQEATGRSFKMGGDLELSLFPWAGISLKDVSLGNPEGFETENFAKFSEFEVRMKILPLLSRDVQVKHIVLNGLRVVLEKNQNGKVNWQFAAAGGAGNQAAPVETTRPEEGKSEPGEALPIKKFEVGEISVTDGSILFINRQSNTRKELSDVDIHVANISLDEPVELSLSGRLDDNPFSLKGNVGPVGSKPGKGNINLNLTAQVFDALELKLNGRVADPATKPTYQMHVTISPFSPKRLMKKLDPERVPSFSDPAVLEKLGLDLDLSGDTQQAALTNGKMVLDDTHTTFQINAKDFSKPDVSWLAHMDTLDVDRYLPPKSEQGAGTSPNEGASDTETAKTADIDYSPLRTLVVNGSVEVDELKAGGGSFQNLLMKVSGANGKFKVDPFSLNLYEGNLSVESNVDVTGKKPKSELTMTLDGVQVLPLLRDFINKDFISGTAQGRIFLTMTGDSPAQIKQTLNGNGSVQFREGTIKGLDLLGMVQNLQAAFKGESKADNQGTEFSELETKFTIAEGVIRSTDTKLLSPVLKVDARGSADLVKETIDFRVDPTYINPLNQKESGLSISGTQVPVLITGTFSNPKFKPDLGSAAKKAVTEKLTKKLGDVLGKPQSEESETDGEPEKQETVEDSVKSLLKDLPFGK